MTNIILIICSGIIFLILIIKYFSLQKVYGRNDFFEKDKYSLNAITSFVKKNFQEILHRNLYSMNLTKEEYEKEIKKRKTLRKALKTCIYGDLNSKNYIKSYIKDILLKEYEITEETIDRVINFNSPRKLSTQDQFEILLFWYKKNYRYRALEYLIEENNLDKFKDKGSYYISKDEIKEIYFKKIRYISDFKDKLDIVVQRIYQRYKGYGVIDEIRDMKIDGVSGGVSGIPESFFQKYNEREGISKFARLDSAYDSIWIFFKGKSIHLRFLSFKKQRELIRVCKNIYKYNNPGQLTEVEGYKVNKMKDGSRIVVVRPPFAETWAFFLRKFDSLEKIDISKLIVDKSSEICIGLIKWIIKGAQVTAITGSQGTGKTTLLMSLISFINPTYNLRIQEMAFELHLRSLYPRRNILTFKETEDISGQQGLDLQKKTDGSVNILGEVASAPVASWMIQMSQVASLFTIFTHHAKTSDYLVKSLRNNLLQTKVFSNEKVAEKQVSEVIRFDIHLKKDINGHRYVERISEICLLNQKPYPMEYKKFSGTNKTEKFYDTMTEYFKRQTREKEYYIRDLVKWEKGKYYVNNSISKKSYGNILAELPSNEKKEFIDFFRKYELIEYE